MAYLDKEQFWKIPSKEIFIEKQSIEMTKSPVISVIVLAYNHAEYIEECLNSLVSQENIGFSFEVLIGEDKSSDSTLEICIKFKKQYPNLIRLVTADQNVGMHRNFARLWCRAKGDYIAFCEADDYWVAPQKLFKQLNFFKSHPECNLCGTYTQLIEKGDDNKWFVLDIMKPVNIKDTYSFEDMITRYNFHFSSVMIRKKAVEFPTWFWTVYCVDRPLYLLASQNNCAGLIPEITSVYRQHSSGSWSTLEISLKSQKSIELFGKIFDHFGVEYKYIINRALSHILWSYSSSALGQNDIPTARKMFLLSIKYSSIHDVKEFIIRLCVIIFKSLKSS